MSIARHRLAVRTPMRPKPIIRTVLPARSMWPRVRRSRQSPPWTIAFIATTCFARASMKVSVCSATLTEFSASVIIRGMPRRVSAATSTLSYPTPIRATTRNRWAASISAWPKWVWPSATPSTQRSAGCRLAGGASSSNRIPSTSRRLFRTSQPALARLSGNNTRSCCSALIWPGSRSRRNEAEGEGRPLLPMCRRSFRRMGVEQSPFVGLCFENIDRLDHVVIGTHAQRPDRRRIGLQGFYLIANGLPFRRDLRCVAGCLRLLHRIGIHIDDVIGRGVELARIDDGFTFRLQFFLELFNELLGPSVVPAAIECSADKRAVAVRTHPFRQIDVGDV